MKMTRAFNFLVGGLLLLSLTSCSQKQAPETVMTPPPVVVEKSLPPLPQEKPAPLPVVTTHKIGLLLPLSGPHEALGRGMLQAAEMALFETGSSSVTLLPQDTAQGGAHKAALKALDAGAELLVGPLFAAEVEAIKPLLHTRHVNLISFSTDQSVASPHTFVLGFLPSQQIERITQFAKEKGLTRIAALTPEGQYGQLINQTLRKLHVKGDIQLLGIIPYTKGDILEGNPGNIRILEDIELYKTKGMEALLIPEGGENLAYLMAIVKPQLPFQLLGSGQWDTAETFRNASLGLEGGLFPSTTSQERQSFEARYREAYGQEPPRIATLAFDAIALAVSLADKGYTAQHLTFFEGFSGMDGLFRLTPQGLNERGLAVLEVTPSGFKTVSPAPETF
jgi:ABC-type branched-subunit amino acid transport system substrate-binding protein